jgi:hypothetical protein
LRLPNSGSLTDHKLAVLEFDVAKGIWLGILVLVVAGCASAPTWEGMSESQIAAWRNVGVEAEWAQQYAKAGIDPAAYSDWTKAGFSSGEAILDWAGEGFAAKDAGDWVSSGFDLDSAVDWQKENFSPADAKAWKDADFSLSKAVDERSKGLSPVR